MSEYQHYEFMTVDLPLTQAQIDEVVELSSHIEVTSTTALIEYHHGDFKYNPVDVLYKYFDGFLYWANWGAPQFALRFPHGSLPDNFFEGYDFGDFVTFTKHSDYDILNIIFGDLEGPDEWIEYELKSLIALRDELLNGDLRALYIVWLAARFMIDGYYEEDDDNKDGDDDSEAMNGVPAVPPGLGALTTAQEQLVNLFQVPQELIDAASQYNHATVASKEDDFVSWVQLMPQDRRTDYLVRFARNEPGLYRRFVKELRNLGQDKTSKTSSSGERVSFAVLLAESHILE